MKILSWQPYVGKKQTQKKSVCYTASVWFHDTMLLCQGVSSEPVPRLMECHGRAWGMSQFDPISINESLWHLGGGWGQVDSTPWVGRFPGVRLRNTWRCSLAEGWWWNSYETSMKVQFSIYRPCFMTGEIDTVKKSRRRKGTNQAVCLIKSARNLNMHTWTHAHTNTHRYWIAHT